MEKLIDLNFCKLVYSSEDKYINKEKELIVKAFKYNKKFFKICPSKFEIMFVYSRHEFNSLIGEKTKDFVSGFFKDSKIFLFGYSVFDKETRWKKKSFYECLVHEMSHLFYEELRDDSFDPLWLSEGLATFIQCRKKKFKYKRRLKIKKEILEEGFKNMNLESYQVYLLFVEYLIKKFGKDKLFYFITKLKKGKKVNFLFKKIYKNTFEKLIENGNKYHKLI